MDNYVRIVNFSCDRYSIKELVIPHIINGLPVKGIGETAFSDYEIQTFIVPKYLEYIRERAFFSCYIRKIKWNDRLLSIGKKAFFATGLEQLHLPDSINYIGEGAFAYNSIKDLKIGRGLTEIYRHTFLDNEMKTLIIPSSVKIIHEDAFKRNIFEDVIIEPNGTPLVNKEIFLTKNLYLFRVLSNPEQLTGIFVRNIHENIIFDEVLDRMNLKSIFGTKK